MGRRDHYGGWLCTILEVTEGVNWCVDNNLTILVSDKYVPTCMTNVVIDAFSEDQGAIPDGPDIGNNGQRENH